MSNFQIRNFTREDYSALQDFWNRSYPDKLQTIASLDLDDRMLNPTFVRRRWVATSKERIVGIAIIEHWAAFYHHDQLLLHLLMRQEEFSSLLASNLYDIALDEALNFNPTLIRTLVREDDTSLAAFFQERGFANTTVRRYVKLDVQSCDLGPFVHYRKQQEELGNSFLPVQELINEPEALEKLHVLYKQVMGDVPEPVPPIPSFDEFMTNFQSYGIRQFSWIAKNGNDFVGLIFLRPDVLYQQVYVEVMGVERGHRRSHVGLVLLMNAIEKSRAANIMEMAAHTDWQNGGTMALTKQLGFEYPISHILFDKKIGKSPAK